MVQFAEAFPDARIVVSLIRQLTWTHFIALIPMRDQLKRDFYSEMCRLEHWSVRTLRHKIDSMLYERTALSKKPDKLIRKELLRYECGTLPRGFPPQPIELRRVGRHGRTSLPFLLEVFVFEMPCTATRRT